MAHALFPGTFDPPTLGHLDIVTRASGLLGRVTIGLAEHPSKKALFSVEERTELWRECVGGLSGVDVQPIEGLVVHACQAIGCDLIVRGVRSGTDFDYEMQMAGTNRSIAPGFDTLFLPAAPQLAHITSTLVRQIAHLGGEVEGFVPAPIVGALEARFRRS